jgi:hypothetical protein
MRYWNSGAEGLFLPLTGKMKWLFRSFANFLNAAPNHQSQSFPDIEAGQRVD